MPESSDPEALRPFTLYHRAVRDVRGDSLQPLNVLRELHPDVYAREAAKYVGREALMQERVERLDCLWNDVLFFSPVHPGPLLDAVRATGREVSPVRFWTLIRIPFVSLTDRNTTDLSTPRPEPARLLLASARIERSLQPIQSESV